MSIARLEEGATFTLVATGLDIAILNGIDYLAGGPCVDAAHREQVLEFNDDDVLHEEAWHLFAAATAAHAVRSTLTLPMLERGRVVGTVNLYAASRRAFVGHHVALADIFGAWAGGAMANADLSSGPDATLRPPASGCDSTLVNRAIGVLSQRLGVDPSTAAAHLHDAAQRSGVRIVDMARSVLDAHRPGAGHD